MKSSALEIIFTTFVCHIYHFKTCRTGKEKKKEDTLRDCYALYISSETGCYPDTEHFSLASVFMEINEL